MNFHNVLQTISYGIYFKGYLQEIIVEISLIKIFMNIQIDISRYPLYTEFSVSKLVNYTTFKLTLSLYYSNDVLSCLMMS